MLTGPEDGSVYQGAAADIGLMWRSSHILQPDEYYQVTLRFTEGGAEARQPVYVQNAEWYVSDSLYLRADQETERLYRWSVRLVRRTSGSGADAEYVVLSAPSEEWSFHWR